jgi:DNA-binding NtrC family response regulator
MNDMSKGWQVPPADDPLQRDDPVERGLDRLRAGGLRVGVAHAVPLLLAGDMRDTIDIARELARLSHRDMSVRQPTAETLDRMRLATPNMVMVEVPIDMPGVLARLRGEHHARVRAGVPMEGMVGRTIAQVEQALILATLTHCRGNRTLASHMLGISVRTMRNKLRTFIEDGIAVSPA